MLHLSAPETRPAPGSLERVRVEPLATRLRWDHGDWTALLALAVVLSASLIAGLLPNRHEFVLLSETAALIVATAFVVVSQREVLAAHWRALWAAPVTGLLLVATATVLLLAAAVAAAAVLPPRSTGLSTAVDLSLQHVSVATLLFLALGPVATAVIGDVAFRRTLLLRLPVWQHRWLACIVLIANAALFGAVHTDDIGDWARCLAYAGFGLVLNLLYLVTRNLWPMLLAHGLISLLLGGPLAALLQTVLSR